MTVVSGEIRDVLGAELDVARVILRAPRPRSAAFGLVTDHPDEVKLSGGKVSFECLPGPAVLGVMAVGHPDVSVRLIVPDGDTATLEECLRLSEARDVTPAGAIDEMVVGIKNDMQAVRAAATSASSSAGAAGRSATAAGKSEENASRSEKNAKTSEANAQSHASEAAKHEVAAKGYADDSAKAATRAGEIATSTSWDGDRLTVNGKTSPPLTAPKTVFTISDKGTWVIDGKDTGEPVRGRDGTMTFDDLTPAQRAKLTPEVKDGVWWVGGVSTGVKAQGEPGPAGTVSGFTISDNGAINIGHTQGKNRDYSVSIGEGSGADTYGVTVGYGASGSGENSVTVGYAVINNGDESVAVGPESEVTSEHGTAVGRRASASGESAVAVGDEADAGGKYSVAIGRASDVTGAGSAAIGPMHTVHADGETHVGLNSAAAASLSVRDPKVVLHGTAESTEPASRPEHLINKGYVDAVKADVETKATVKMVVAPPADFEPNVLYVIPENGGRA